MSTLEERPQRADARRNRAAIVKAARAVFAKQGRDAQMDDVARRAKVGVGTLYRHFPTKEALLLALVEDKFTRMVSLADQALEREDPWDALETFLEQGARMHAQDRSLTQAIMELPDIAAAAAHASGIQERLERLMGGAQAAGVVRADARWEDIPMAFCALGQVEGPPRASWQRMLGIVLDGLRAPGAATLPN